MKLIFLGKKDIGYKPSDFKEVFQRIKRESKMDQFDLELFKEKFKIINTEMYDVMSYEKGGKFDQWIETNYNALSKS